MFNFVNGDLDISHKLDYASSPGDEYSKHMHYFNEILYFIDGDVDYTVESETKHLHPGDLIFIQPGKYHFATVNRNVLYERYVLKFPEEMIPNELKTRFTSFDPFLTNAQSADYIFKSLDSFASRIDDVSLKILAKCKIIELLVIVSQEGNKLKTDAPVSVISTIIDYISKNIHSDLSLKKIAKDLNYSESYISNTFRKTMKSPIMQYIRSKKAIIAHSLIIHGRKPQDVAEALGFQDYSTFYRSYLKTIGFSPSKSKK